MYSTIWEYQLMLSNLGPSVFARRGHNYLLGLQTWVSKSFITLLVRKMNIYTYKFVFRPFFLMTKKANYDHKEASVTIDKIFFL